MRRLLLILLQYAERKSRFGGTNLFLQNGFCLARKKYVWKILTVCKKMHTCMQFFQKYGV